MMHGNTALHGASHLRYEQLIQLLVAHGAQLNVKNIDGQTPLDVAERSVQLFGNPVIEHHTRRRRFITQTWCAVACSRATPTLQTSFDAPPVRLF